MKLKKGAGPVIAQREFYIKGDKNKKIILRILGATADDPDFYIDMDGVDAEKYPCMFGGSDTLQSFMMTAFLLKSKIERINEQVFGGNLRRFEDDDTDLGIRDTPY